MLRNHINDLVKKGYKIKPFAEKNYEKTLDRLVSPENYKKIHGYYRNQMNPRFEFEERILGNLPTKDIKLMDFAKIPINFGTWKPALGKGLWGTRRPQPNLQKLIDTVLDMNQKSTQLPVVMSEQVRNTLKKVEPYLMDMYTKNNPNQAKALEKLMSAPTYKYSPFKLENEFYRTVK